MFIYIKTSVIGTGFVGLITGNCLGETGNEVLCIDIDQAKVEKLQSGIVPIYESHSDVLFDRNIEAPVIFGGRNLYDANDVNFEGFSYTSIARKTTMK